MAVLQITNLSVYFEGKKKEIIPVFENLNLLLPSGSINVLMGPSGSGKTSILNCIAGKLLYEGEISIDGQDIKKEKIKDLGLSLCGQDFILYPKMTVYDNIAFPLRATRVEHELADQKVKEAAGRLGLTPFLTRKPKFLSKGQARRVGLARSLVGKSKIMLFDEPLEGLDERNAKKATSFILQKAKEYGSTVLFVTHRGQEALSIGETIYVLHGGELSKGYTPYNLLHSHDKAVIEALGDL